jgi:hypothetical protein
LSVEARRKLFEQKAAQDTSAQFKKSTSTPAAIKENPFGKVSKPNPFGVAVQPRTAEPEIPKTEPAGVSLVVPEIEVSDVKPKKSLFDLEENKPKTAAPLPSLFGLAQPSSKKEPEIPQSKTAKLGVSLFDIPTKAVPAVEVTEVKPKKSLFDLEDTKPKTPAPLTSLLGLGSKNEPDRPQSEAKQLGGSLFNVSEEAKAAPVDEVPEAKPKKSLFDLEESKPKTTAPLPSLFGLAQPSSKKEPDLPQSKTAKLGVSLFDIPTKAVPAVEVPEVKPKKSLFDLEDTKPKTSAPLTSVLGLTQAGSKNEPDKPKSEAKNAGGSLLNASEEAKAAVEVPEAKPKTSLFDLEDSKPKTAAPLPSLLGLIQAGSKTEPAVEPAQPTKPRKGLFDTEAGALTQEVQPEIKPPKPVPLLNILSQSTAAKPEAAKVEGADSLLDKKPPAKKNLVEVGEELPQQRALPPIGFLGTKPKTKPLEETKADPAKPPAATLGLLGLFGNKPSAPVPKPEDSKTEPPKSEAEPSSGSSKDAAALLKGIFTSAPAETDIVIRPRKQKMSLFADDEGNKASDRPKAKTSLFDD